MATWNGAPYLPQQLESILRQRDVDWRLIARDDGSTDGTKEILTRFWTENPVRCRLLPADGRLGPAGNFGRLLAATTAPLVACCDQDDIWDPDRLRMGCAAAVAVPGPVLVHSDARLINAAGTQIGTSLHASESMNPRKGARLPRLLRQSCIWGCTTVMNRALLDAALPIPGRAVMHDWWLSLVAAVQGRIYYLPKAMISYRIHESNVFGASHAQTPIEKLMAWSSTWKRRQSHRDTSAAQALALHQRFANNPVARLAARYAHWAQLDPISRRCVAIQSGFTRHGLMRNLGDIVLPG